MVSISTLFHRVDGFNDKEKEPACPDLQELLQEERFLKELLTPLVYDPGDGLVRAILEKST